MIISTFSRVMIALAYDLYSLHSANPQ